jgi:hypothetical protein
MSKETDFLLGIAFGLLTQARSFMIKHELVEGVELIEDEYQSLRDGINKQYYTKKPDGESK